MVKISILIEERQEKNARLRKIERSDRNGLTEKVSPTLQQASTPPLMLTVLSSETFALSSLRSICGEGRGMENGELQGGGEELWVVKLFL